MFVSNFSLFACILFASCHLVSAAPCSKTNPAGYITAADLIQMGALANCSTASFPSECRTAHEAAPFVNQAFTDYSIVTDGEKAALLSLMIFESGGFAFDINHSQNNPGQGTRDEMTFPFILQYALDTPSVAARARQLAGVNINNASAIPADTENAIRALVLTDALSFASAAWFYTRSGPDKTGCTETPGMVEGLQAATLDGWMNYITDCVFTTVTAGRQSIYETTLNVLMAKTQN